MRNSPLQEPAPLPRPKPRRRSRPSLATNLLLSSWTAQVLIAGIPPKPETSAVRWGERNVKLPGSARSSEFHASITPWTSAPLETVADGLTRISTFVKPVQSGGSVAGEVALCYVLATQNSGDVQYNWENDEKAAERWAKRIDRILRACDPVMLRAPSSRGSERHKWQKGLVMFPHCNLTVQGVFTSDNLDSDSIRFQFNEEIHNWEPGRLGKAYKRTTAFWNSFIMNISNAGFVGDQLHQAFQEGTQEHWEVKCPGCGLYHVMRTEWDPRHPELGGLRYDSKKSKRSDGSYDYNKLASTIRFQMPCGAAVKDSAADRRALSLGGRYGAPRNTGAHVTNRSFTLEGVAVDYISWLTLIQEKHTALRALKYGDPELWIRYLQERECRFYNKEERPLVGRIVINTSLKKDREGLKANPLFFARLFALDRQQGSLAKGEVPHWWLVIRDVLTTGDSQLVFEGKVLTDENVIDTLDRHGCMRRHGVADSGDDTTHVYQFCLKYGIHAIKGSGDPYFAHPNGGGRKIFSPERPLWQMLNMPGPTREDPLDEPLFFLYSKHGIRERLHWLRAGGAVKWEVPGDVSEDYQKHNEAEELTEDNNPRTGEIRTFWKQVRERNDLFVDECYIAMQMERAGLIGAGAK